MKKAFFIYFFLLIFSNSAGAVKFNIIEGESDYGLDMIFQGLGRLEFSEYSGSEDESTSSEDSDFEIDEENTSSIQDFSEVFSKKNTPNSG